MTVAIAVLIAAAAAPPATSAAPTRVDLAMASHASSLDFRLTNTGATPFPFSERAWDRVTLAIWSGGTGRTLHFERACAKCIDKDYPLVHGDSLTHMIDVASWIAQAGEAPLAPGDYQVVATIDLGSRGVLTATSSLKLAAPREQPCTERFPDRAKHIADGIELLVRQVDQTDTIEVGLHNTAARTQCVASTIQAGEQQSDWLRVALGGRTLVFHDARDKSTLATVELPPGATAWQRWDLAAWAMRAPNGSRPLSSITGLATVTYGAGGEPGVWDGSALATVLLSLR